MVVGLPRVKVEKEHWRVLRMPDGVKKPPRKVLHLAVASNVCVGVRDSGLDGHASG